MPAVRLRRAVQLMGGAKKESGQALARLPAVLLPWYDENRRVLPWREEVTPYRTWVSEVMLQQTRVQAALPYFLRFMEAAPDIPALAALSEAAHAAVAGAGVLQPRP